MVRYMAENYIKNQRASVTLTDLVMCSEMTYHQIMSTYLKENLKTRKK